MNNGMDTTPPRPNVTYAVKHTADGTPYVAASDGNRYSENSTIGRIYLKQDDASRTQRSDVLPSSSSHQPQQPQQPVKVSDSVEKNTSISATGLSKAGEAKNAEQAARRTKRGPISLLAYKAFPLEKRRERGRSAIELKAPQKEDDKVCTAPVDSTDAASHQRVGNEVPMLDPNTVDRSRADSSWETPRVKSDVQEERECPQLDAIRLLDSHGMQTAEQAKFDLLADPTSPTNDSNGSSLLSPLSAASSIDPTDPISVSTKPLPEFQSTKDSSAPPLAFDAYDEDNNPLCQSFLHVRNVDLISSMADELEDDEEHENGQDEEHEHIGVDIDDDIPDVDRPDSTDRVCVSPNTTNVAEYVGGFKSQLSLRSGANGLATRKRAVRQVRLSAEEQKAADLARKIREARNRIPLELRDENMSPAAKNELKKKKKKRTRSRHVRFNPNVSCREFEVESEEEDDGYYSPDEIVDAVKLVSKRDVVHAEDVVAVLPMEQLELPPAGTMATIVQAPSPSAIGFNDQNDKQNAFSQFSDERMSFSDL